MGLFTSSDYILAFDMIERNFFKISLPMPSGDVFLECLGGFLSVCIWRSTPIGIWVMKEYKVRSSWTVFKISNSIFEPIYFTKGGEIIGVNLYGRRLEKYKGELLEHCPSYHYEYYSLMYTESLLSLPSDSESEVASKDDQQ